MLEVGSVFDRKYKILQELGHGGMSTVYLALNERANKTWAIKEVRKSGMTDNVVSSQSLMAEVDMLKKLNHPNIVNIVDVVENDDSFIIVMDYIEGKDLLSVVTSHGPIDPDSVTRWMIQLCDVMGYLHSRRPPIIYRDMKPANVMLKPDGNVIVIDFGTARTNKGGNNADTTWLGTRGYAAPEQFGGQGETDARTDIYTLGATMYHLLTGYSPAQTKFVIYPIGQLRPELSGSGIEKIVAKCCEPRREDRYQSAAELMYALEHVHDEDDETRKKDNKKMRLFLAPVITFLIGVAAMVGFSVAKNVTIQNTYESSLLRATTAGSLEDGRLDFRSALAMQPDNEDGYNALLESIVNDSNKKFTLNERRMLQDILTTRPVTVQGENCEDVFRERNRAAYDKFHFDLGLLYFRYFTDGYKYAADELKGLDKSEYLTDKQKNQAKSYYEISSIVEANMNGIGSTTVFGDVEGLSWFDAYTRFYELLGNANEATINCGSEGNAYATYGTFASLVHAKTKQFIDAGVKAQQLLDIIEAGKECLRTTSGGSSDQPIKLQAEQLLAAAEKDVKASYDDIGTNSAS